MARLVDVELMRPLQLLWDATRESTPATRQFLEFLRASRPR